MLLGSQRPTVGLLLLALGAVILGGCDSTDPQPLSIVATASPTASTAATVRPTQTAPATIPATSTPVAITPTPRDTVTQPATATATPTETATSAPPTATASASATETATETETPTPTGTATETATATWTLTPTPVPTLAFTWDLPKGFPVPNVPEDNPMSYAKVDLGRYLFYDKRLSGNETFSCASCHQQSRAFTDGLPRAMGSTGQTHPRNSMSLTNVAYATTLTWANPLLSTFAQQALGPMFGTSPVELGLDGLEDEMLARLRDDERYQSMFPAAFPDDDDPFTTGNVVRAIGTFERTLISGHSPFDRWLYEFDDAALSDSAKRGMDLFFSERMECFHCHGGFNFTDSVSHAGSPFQESNFHNTGLYNIDGNGAYPPDNTGIMAITGKPDDMGRFKAPTLRNIELTAPYMHDGSIATLEDVITEQYGHGGRLITSGPYAGDGSLSPLKSGFMIGFSLSPQELEDVVNFLKSLTDEEFVTNPKFSDPFATDGQ